MKVAKRTDAIAPFYVMELLEKAKEMEASGRDIVHMEVGEPDFPTPFAIKEGAIQSIRSDRTFYTHSLGLPELRARVSRHYRETDGLVVPPERIVITNGTSGAFLLLFAALLERGKSLGISDPGYPCYKNIASLLDCEILSIPVTEETRFEVTQDHLDALDRLPDLLVLANPSNPTGAVYREGTLSSLYGALSAEDRLLVVDEIYLGLAYGDKPRSALAVSDDIIVVNGFSKAYAMTGWRLGWMVVPRELVRPIQKFAQNIYISPPSISQHAALYAFDNVGGLDRMRKTYEERGGLMVPRLKDLGFRVPIKPEGAFYVYAGIERWGIDSMVFTERALNEAGVAFTPGYDFGSFRAGSHVRFSYATGIERLKEGCDRLKKWLAGLK
ncbi:MAG TPA: aminotransferase class I/II-fold pyridoxal phosphate-dependent enzyme [Syntrophorhabdaceae bacterium]|mgnify:CR=1 FL=1|nr:aminotransferase class I/II-fold pyridoxal phosphate-dependent enzyme [Syntrophorhabdaceae bacterium]HQM81542.1 aminotransferase class I/II-fold pyridoxal phosphate-dependent enzyme [Syntrophorhabdaceae bacterium]